MAGPPEALGPTYISSRSADVILSDIRPIKLNIDALRSLNVLLDEFLYSVLNAARSLTTHQLRVGLLKVLPTTLGKEALLEAEMELRAYLERTVTSGAALDADEQGKDFYLQWYFELLRLKCQAYSTLSDSDEDAHAEARLSERMSHAVPAVSPPKATLVAPAALYLTAILESVCEHVLSNVGRVAARDSSRTTATVQDLFVALCEDGSIYGFFKTMKVYEQIEILSRIPKPRRSKSFSRPSESIAVSVSRLSSSQRADSHPPSSLTQSSSLPPRSRLSSESSAMTTAMLVNSNASNSRSSFDKARTMKMFSNSRSSTDSQAVNGSLNDSQHLHKKSESVLSEGMKQTIAAYNIGDQSPTDDQEFDDMMRSGDTMKVSLTPDRLKSMEVYNKEKSGRGTRKSVHKTNSRGSLKSNKVIPPTPELPHNVRQLSIIEDEKPGNKISAHRIRQKSLSNSIPPVTARLRSVSASMPSGEPLSHAARKKTPAFFSTPPSTYQFRERNMPVQQPIYISGSPARTAVPNRESLDLDDVMAISDDDDAPQEVVVKTPVQRPTQYPVSAGARELINFLAEGPPDMPEEPAGAGKKPFSQNTQKKGGRLQRMISKLTLKDTEQKSSNTSNSAELYSRGMQSDAGPSAIPLPMSPLYNKPVPPRPSPIAMSPPTTPSQSSTSLVESSPQVRDLSNTQKTVSSSRDVTPVYARTPVPLATEIKDFPSARVALPSSKPPSTNGQAKQYEKSRSSPSRVLKQSSSGTNDSFTKVSPSVLENEPTKGKTFDADQPTVLAALCQHAQDMRRLLTSATNADECRLIVDMFLAKSGLHVESVDHSKPYLPTNALRPLSTSIDVDLEHSLVELFLGGAGEDGEVDGDEQIMSPADSASSKANSVVLPVSPPDTPDSSNGNGVKTAELIVVKDTHVVTPARIAAT